MLWWHFAQLSTPSMLSLSVGKVQGRPTLGFFKALLGIFRSRTLVVTNLKSLCKYGISEAVRLKKRMAGMMIPTIESKLALAKDFSMSASKYPQEADCYRN